MHTIIGKYPVVNIDSMKYLVFSRDWNFNKSMLKSPIIYDSLFSLSILAVMAANLVVKLDDLECTKHNLYNRSTSGALKLAPTPTP